MADRTRRLLVESSPKKVFVVALDWPGLARAGKTEEAAVDELLAHLRCTARSRRRPAPTCRRATSRSTWSSVSRAAAGPRSASRARS